MWRLALGAALALTSSAGLAQAATQAPLNLTCGGAGTAHRVTSNTAYTNGYASGIVGTTTVSGSRDIGFADQVDIRLFSGDDRIRMPRSMLPMFHGGEDGWFKLKDVKVDARTIRASAAVNFMNNPKIYIDRVTGTISISGKSGHYSGECQVIDANAPAKF